MQLHISHLRTPPSLYANCGDFCVKFELSAYWPISGQQIATQARTFPPCIRILLHFCSKKLRENFDRENASLIYLPLLTEYLVNKSRIRIKCVHEIFSNSPVMTNEIKDMAS